MARCNQSLCAASSGVAWPRQPAVAPQSLMHPRGSTSPAVSRSLDLRHALPCCPLPRRRPPIRVPVGARAWRAFASCAVTLPRPTAPPQPPLGPSSLARQTARPAATRPAPAAAASWCAGGDIRPWRRGGGLCRATHVPAPASASAPYASCLAPASCCRGPCSACRAHARRQQSVQPRPFPTCTHPRHTQPPPPHPLAAAGGCFLRPHSGAGRRQRPHLWPGRRLLNWRHPHCEFPGLSCPGLRFPGPCCPGQCWPGLSCPELCWPAPRQPGTACRCRVSPGPLACLLSASGRGACIVAPHPRATGAYFRAKPWHLMPSNVRPACLGSVPSSHAPTPPCPPPAAAFVGQHYPGLPDCQQPGGVHGCHRLVRGLC